MSLLLKTRSPRLGTNSCVTTTSGTACHLMPLMPRPALQQRTVVAHATPSATATMVEQSVAPPAPAHSQQSFDSMSQAYSRAMKDAMGWDSRPYDYDYSRGLYYHEIIPGLFCGSQPRHKADVKELKAELGVTAILSLQQEKDQLHWGVNPEEVRSSATKLNINYHRQPVKDFDPHSLRKTLPQAVAKLHDELAKGGKVYVHCTAGLGRAPAVVIAYLYWFKGIDLNAAYDFLTSIRPCGPKKEAIRGATYDLMSGQPMDNFQRTHPEAYSALSDVDRYALQWRVLRT